MIYLLIIAIFAFAWAFPRTTWMLWYLGLVALCWQLSQQAQAAPWPTRDGWGRAAINGYGGDPCFVWEPAEHRWIYACDKRSEKRKDDHK